MKARTFVYGHHFPDNLMWHFSAHLSLTLYVNLEGGTNKGIGKSIVIVYRWTTKLFCSFV